MRRRVTTVERLRRIGAAAEVLLERDVDGDGVERNGYAWSSRVVRVSNARSTVALAGDMRGIFALRVHRAGINSCTQARRSLLV